MAVDNDRFNRAAKDGYLDLLHEATRKDCNTPDEDGMTPTMWASYYGHLDALRLIVGRGGDPDKCDNYGNTALHYAAANSHLNCVSFLVNFGVNLWALDNDFHTAKDIAAMKQREDILRYLDEAIAKQSNLNKKHVQKLKEKSIKDAEKRIKNYNKLQKKASRRAEKEEKQLQKEKNMMLDTNRGTSLISLRKDSTQLYAIRRYSDLVNNTENNRKGFGAVSKKILQKKNASLYNEFKIREFEQDGKKSIRSLSGLKRDTEVMYVQNTNQSPQMKEMFDSPGELQRAVSEPGYLNIEELPVSSDSMFERPGFGSIAFRNPIHGTLSSLPPSEIHPNGSVEDSIGSAGSLTRRTEELPWDIDTLDLDDEEEFDPSALITFMSTISLSEYIPLFTRERIDLDALVLLTEEDFKSIGLPLGPRRKLAKALEERKTVIDEPGDVIDSYL